MRTRKPDGRTATLPATRVTPEERQRIERDAAERGIKVSAWIREAIQAFQTGRPIHETPSDSPPASAEPKSEPPRKMVLTEEQRQANIEHNNRIKKMLGER